MDSRDAPPPSGPPNMMVGPNSYSAAMANNNHQHHQHHQHHQANNNNNNAHAPPMIGSAQMIGGGGGPGRFPFNSVSPPPQPPVSKPPMDSLGVSANPYDGSSPPQPGMRPCVGGGGGSGGLSIDSGAKKKRGRPRKYSPDGNIALGLAPTPMSSSGTGGGGAGGGGSHGDSGGNGPSSDPSSKKNRGRPPGSGKRQLDALGAGGIGFTPHVILVNAGEDIASKVMAFSQQGPRTVCILSANGAICNVTIRQPATTGGTVSYEGRFEIISLSGSFFVNENNGNRTRSGGLSVSLAGPDGRVLGGGVVGNLVAASSVQVIVGSFLADGKKSGSSNAALKSAPAGPQPQMLDFGGHIAAGSPQSQGESSESSEENGNSPLNRGPGFFNNASNNQQLHHNMPMYHHMWTGQAQQ